MNLKKIYQYKNLFNKCFFFDKCSFTNVFQCPKVNFLKLKFFLSSNFNFNKSKLSKIILLFYILTSQKPKLFIQSYNLRNTKSKKISNLLITMYNFNHFFEFLIYRQFALISSFIQTFPSVIHQSVYTFEIIQKIQDDDFFFQSLKIEQQIKYQITLISNSLSKSHLQSLLRNFKIPCKLIK